MIFIFSKMLKLVSRRLKEILVYLYYSLKKYEISVPYYVYKRGKVKEWVFRTVSQP